MWPFTEEVENFPLEIKGCSYPMFCRAGSSAPTSVWFGSSRVSSSGASQCPPRWWDNHRTCTETFSKGELEVWGSRTESLYILLPKGNRLSHRFPMLMPYGKKVPLYFDNFFFCCFEYSKGDPAAAELPGGGFLVSRLKSLFFHKAKSIKLINLIKEISPVI